MCCIARIGRILAILVLFSAANVLLLSSATAGEIYGRVAKNRKPLQGARISINCAGLTHSKTTDRNGVYRFSGPQKEVQCTVSVDGSNPVSFFTTRRRTRVNLEIIGNRLYRR